MPYNPHAPGGPTYRNVTNTPVGHHPGEDVKRAQSPSRGHSLEPAYPETQSPRGHRLSTNTSQEFILVRLEAPGGQWTVYPCGPRSGLTGEAMGRGETMRDALADAGFYRSENHE